MKTVRLSAHATLQLPFRGVDAEEVVDAIQTAAWLPAERGRLECRKTYPFGREWNGRLYASKQVRPIFVDEEAEIVVVTVYTYF